MPPGGELLAAARAATVEEVRALIAGGANIEESDAVSDGARAGIERFLCCRLCLAHWCEVVNDECPRA